MVNEFLFLLFIAQYSFFISGVDLVSLDAHCHWSFYEDDLESALAELNVHPILVVSVSGEPSAYQKTLEIAKRSPYIIPAFGIHPSRAAEYVNQLDQFTDLIINCLMLGEIGLDHFFIKDTSQYPVQRQLFEFFLNKAKTHNLIVNLHTKGADEETITLLDAYGITRVIMQQVLGPIELLAKVVDRGFYITVSQSVLPQWETTIPHWKRIQTIAQEVPQDLLLTETDGPGPPPRQMPYTKLQPIIAHIAKLRKTNIKEINHTVISNFQSLIHGDSKLNQYSLLLQQSQLAQTDQ